MVDRSRRSQAAQVLRDFMAGRLTNFDFEEQFPQSGSDRVLAAIAEMVWFTYDDLKTHRLEGEYTLPDAGEKSLSVVCCSWVRDWNTPAPEVSLLQIYRGTICRAVWSDSCIVSGEENCPPFNPYGMREPGRS